MKQLLHIQNPTPGRNNITICGKRYFQCWRADERCGTLDFAMSELAAGRSSKYVLCEECEEHPKLQLWILANTEL